MTDGDDALLDILKALASDKRLRVLDWLKNPRAHFPAQRDGDLVEDGVCGLFIAQKLGLSQPTVHGHMKLLLRAGLVREKRIRQWTFYRRDEAAVAAATRRLAESL
ncbi:transcriptional regulator, ArsR family [Tistlia consotensis]|uniref:Transcriptional regulator, ArsR family n=1 Tax=Tistlia consotensis USBA 355 TaxID=560819 RepID=A0A1Y6BE31_9PROT|nr:helix-turn-helix transcriptional regulator [Tistlia consotensis]SMF02740.1 transcriptional regulator, ArsR family [Tistlia consotensis USBA 355]SNR53030.1 transcriptional regulator, ArsR family [Tistlia consotensis]